MKSRTPIIVAVVIGVLVVFAIRSYVKRVKDEASAQLRGSPVVAATQDMSEGAIVKMTMIYPKEVPDRFIPPQAIRGSAEVAQIVGRKVRFPIAKDQIILWSDLEMERRRGLATVVPGDERAFTMSVAQGVSASLLQPNDHVDIIASVAVPEPKGTAKPTAGAATWREKSDIVTMVLLQNVTILGIGKDFGVGQTGGSSGPGGGSGGMITVSVTLPESQLLSFAQQHGELGIVLRREGNIDTLPREKLPRVTFATLEELIGDLDQQRKHRIIQILKGKDTQEVTVENK
jgi:Flp pilus assembly protein CpaB